MLSVRDVTIRFGETLALDSASLEVAVGEVMAVLGPSGSGKSTLLRVIAGLQPPDAGWVWWNGTEVTDVPTHLRRFGLMFQDYALFPHLTVAGNVGFGLRMEGRPPEQIAGRVREVLDWVDLDGFEHRRMEGLSGGEQQRVALARALAPAPRLLMLDEPLGALDRALRGRLIDDIRRLLTEQRITALYVTHDHDEAAETGDRVAVMRAGRVLQTGTIDELRRQPIDPWVAEFLAEET